MQFYVKTQGLYLALKITLNKFVNKMTNMYDCIKRAYNIFSVLHFVIMQ